MVDITWKKRKWVVLSSIAKIYNAYNSSCHGTFCYSNTRLGDSSIHRSIDTYSDSLNSGK